ncbi:MAG: isoprenylcysteine carboxylmethyltransferase family protein [Deltaproteobacteria bacterium]|nr:isoprenylcysteine carboxylmethyltransferase family protein [Deltaproteobacteria bacterium]
MGTKEGLSKVFSHGDHDRREDLCEEHPYGDAGQIVAFVLFLVVWSLDSFLFHFSTMLSDHIPLVIRLVLAALGFVLAGYIAFTVHRILFDEHRDPPSVINTGAFSMVRHPLYLSVLLLYIGFLFTTLSIASVLLFLGIFIFYDVIAIFEEKKLEEKFGEKYIRYKEKTPRWIPGFKRSK